jgi:hypothetical protein
LIQNFRRTLYSSAEVEHKAPEDEEAEAILLSHSLHASFAPTAKESKD